MRPLIAIIAAVFCFTGIGYAENMSKKAWAEQLSKFAPKGHCLQLKADGELIDDCEVITQYLVNACITRVWHKVPDSIPHPEKTHHFGSMVGDCGRDLLKALRKY
jgi:hypothetical protein